MDLVSVFCRQLTFVEEATFLHCISLVPLSKIRTWCVDLYPGPLFCSTGLHICFCASIMLLLLLWLSSMF
jgi:hypothetical protein